MGLTSKSDVGTARAAYPGVTRYREKKTPLIFTLNRKARLSQPTESWPNEVAHRGNQDAALKGEREVNLVNELVFSLPAGSR